MTPEKLRELLRHTDGDERSAEERAWPVVRGAFREQRTGAPARPPRRRLLAVAAAAAVMVATVVVALTPPGDAVARWVRETIGAGAEPARPALERIPGGGRLLVQTDQATWLVRADGSRRVLGSYQGSSWSPHGLFVLAWRGSELRAIDPRGRVRWSLSRRGTIRSARWGPVDGFRVAYIAGRRLRVVNGDGTGDRTLDGRVDATVAPAWRPDNAHVLAYRDAGGHIRVVAVDSGQLLWRGRSPARVRALAWSADGRLLYALGRRRLSVYDRAGGRRHIIELPGGATGQAMRPSSAGRRVALVRRYRRSARSDVVVVGFDRRGQPTSSQVLFSGPGQLTNLAWSPADTRLLVGWRDADQWLFLRPRSERPILSVGDIARQFDAMPQSGATFPVGVEWCCARTGVP